MSKIDQSSWPPHLRDDAPYQRCSSCGRKTWSVDDFGTECAMPQQWNTEAGWHGPCGGRFLGSTPPEETTWTTNAPPDADTCERIFHAALAAGDARGVEAALVLMAPQDPHRAQLLLDAVKVALHLHQETTA